MGLNLSPWQQILSPLHSCPFLVEHLTVFIPVIGGVLFVFVIISLLRTSFTDPGILPRATPEEAADIEKQIGKGRHEGHGALPQARWATKLCHMEDARNLTVDLSSLLFTKVKEQSGFLDYCFHRPFECGSRSRVLVSAPPLNFSISRYLRIIFISPTSQNQGGPHQPAGGEAQILLHL